MNSMTPPDDLAALTNTVESTLEYLKMSINEQPGVTTDKGWKTESERQEIAVNDAKVVLLQAFQKVLAERKVALLMEVESNIVDKEYYDAAAMVRVKINELQPTATTDAEGK